MSATFERHTHPFEPVVDERSRILILGSFPSVRSRAEGFYYGHPQNRFWAVMAYILEAPLPETVEEKRRMLSEGRVALFDAAETVTVRGSEDAAMRDVVPNDLSPIFETASIRAVFANGQRAYTICRRNGVEAIRLPSTSAANARMRLSSLQEAWKTAIAPYLK